MRSTVWLTAVFPAVLAALPAQDPPAGPACDRCASHGEFECPQHKGDLLEVERAVLHCSVATQCKKCGGSLTIDCKECNNHGAEAAAEQRRELARQWLDERRTAIASLCVEPEAILFLQTAHCDLTFSFEPMTVGKKKLDAHRLMHLYGERIEALRARFVEVFELGAADFPVAADDVSPRLGVHMLEQERDQRAVAPRVTGMGSQGVGVKLMGSFLAYSVVHDPRTLRSDEDVHRAIVHNVTHLLLSSMVPTQWVGNQGNGWIDEGVAHWFEEQVDGKCANFCYEEVGVVPGSNWKNGKWKIGIRQVAEAGKLRKFTELYQLNSDQLDFEAHAHAFAWVDFLIAKFGGSKFADLVRRAKVREPMRDVLQKVYGFGPLEFDTQFEAFVRETYPLR